METQVGHNGGNKLTDAEREALMFHHLRRIKPALDELKQARSDYNQLRKAAKADGIKLRSLDFALRCWEAEDEQVIADDLREQAQIASWFNLPLNFQGSLFDEDRTPADEKAFADGKRAGLQGKSCDAPRELSQKNAQKWIKGWHEGQRIMGEELQAAMEKANAARAEAKPGKANGGAAEGEDDAEADAIADGDPFPDEAVEAQPAAA